ncbi:unannotated protein [freshwater metagenome]|uniref:Unannotated protein n=1 Tax=freshwater metagenome TaxID=449393 RepID=A0A6J6L6P8_9ZZZZ
MSEDTITASKKRSTPVATPLVTAEQTSKYLQFNFLSNLGTTMNASDLYKLVVETQEDVLTVTP